MDVKQNSGVGNATAWRHADGMKRAGRNRADSDSDTGAAATKRQIVAVAERMLGDGGIDRVPLHEIATQAGQANKSAVQYHFNDRAGLISAIFESRVPQIEEFCQSLVSQCSPADLRNPRRLLEIIFLPISEQKSLNGTHSYARFLMQYVTRPEFDHRLRHPFGSPSDPAAVAFEALATVTGFDQETLLRRLYLLTLVFLGALIEHDNAVGFGRRIPDIKRVIATTLDMMTAALMADAQ